MRIRVLIQCLRLAVALAVLARACVSCTTAVENSHDKDSRPEDASGLQHIAPTPAMDLPSPAIRSCSATYFQERSRPRSPSAGRTRATLTVLPGIVAPKGLPRLRKDMPGILQDADNGWPPLVHEILFELLEQFRQVDAHVKAYGGKIPLTAVPPKSLQQAARKV